MIGLLLALDPGGATPDPNTPLCTTDAQIQSWAMPGAIGDPSCHPDPTVAEMVGAPDLPHALAQIVKSLATFWVSTPSPTLANDTGPTGVTAWLTHSMTFWTASFMILSIIIQASKIAWRGKADGLNDLVTNVVRYVMVSTIGAVAVTLTLEAVDGTSQWLIDQSTQGSDFGTNLAKLLGGPAVWGGLGAVLEFLVLGLAVLVGLIQCIVILVRGAVLILLVGTWPLSASVASIEAGKQWYSGHVAWITAFVFYKLAAALVYATAFELMGTNTASSDATLSILYGIAFMLAAVFCLPALIKLAMPHTAPVSGGKGFGAAAAGAGSLLIATSR